MAEVLLFHHSLGLTPGIQAFAETIREAGHVVHLPDLYEGRTFPDIPSGMAYVEGLGFETILARGVAVVDGLPEGLVYAGFSLGVLPAQMLAQTRDGALGALLFSSCVPTSEFGDGWPLGVPVQVHGKDADPIFVDEGDLDAARALVEAAPGEAELFLYPGDEHLFADAGLPTYDEHAARLLTERVIRFLDGIGG